jgi:peptidoglycan hydrolase-like protein with peptidoglycan-binding domain
LKTGALGLGLALAAAAGLLLGGGSEARAAPPASGGVAELYRQIGDPSPGARLLKVQSPLLEGPDVVEWQRLLRAFRPSALSQFGIDGKYGNETRAATEAFQRDANGFYARVGLPDRLTVDGVVGPLTRTAAARRAHELDVAPFAPVVMRGDSPLPGAVPPMTPAPAPPVDLQLASAVALDLLSSRPGTEDRDLVRRFQASEGITASGFYNVQTALQLIAHGLVPPTPFYWGKSGVRAKKRNYRERLEREAERDPVRAAEWLGAARQVT